jgi:transketolase
MRKNILNMAKDQKSGHLGCALCLVEIVSVLYGEVMSYNPKNSEDPERDLLALSKGHGVMALYSAFYQLGWIEETQVDCYLQDNTDLFGLSEDIVPGIEVSGGSLGHGLAVSVGMALGLKLRNSPRRSYCIVGDGEINEGSIWEALLFAGHHKLTNLTVIVDVNGFQAMGRTEEIISLKPLDKKFESFGFDTFECDGHDTDQLKLAFKKAQDSTKPFVIIANTVKGSGIDYMEDENIWHYKKMTDEEQLQAFKTLDEKDEVSK